MGWDTCMLLWRPLSITCQTSGPSASIIEVALMTIYHVIDCTISTMHATIRCKEQQEGVRWSRSMMAIMHMRKGQQ